MNVLSAALCKFGFMSGLRANNAKSQIFYSAEHPDMRPFLTTALGSTEGTLLVRYLGVPLIFPKLREVDCQSLLHKIVSWVKSWRNTSLLWWKAVIN